MVNLLAGDMLVNVIDRSWGCLVYFVSVTWSSMRRHMWNIRRNKCGEPFISCLAHTKRGGT